MRLARIVLLAILGLPLLIGSAMASPRGVLGELFSASG
jgi:hypothetical protein